MRGTVFSWKLEAAGFPGGCGIAFVDWSCKLDQQEKADSGAPKGSGFSEYRNRADSDASLHKGSVVAVGFNLS